MKMLKLFFTLAMAVVLTTALILSTMDEQKQEVVLAGANEDSKENSKDASFQDEQTTPPKKVSRFLADAKNPRAADHCNKDNEVCLLEGSQGSTCCNNKCVDLQTDSKNCGACKRKCKYTDTCCRGECVNLSFDKRHCGKCNNKCMPGGYCIYGMCDYA